MIEGRKLALGEAILSEAASIVREHDQSGDVKGEVARSTDEVMEELVRRHARLVYRIAHAVLRSHHDAEDATQETFLRVLRYSNKLGEVENPKTWLARIAWRVAVDRSQRRGRRREVSLEVTREEEPVEEAMSSEESAYETAHSSQVGAALEKLIAALPDKLRAPLILSALEEMSPVEVAAALGINEAAVRSRVFRARQLLRKKMAAR
jgi:RNA polymerase sigma-70 factor (ECF subfamily)